MKDELKIMEELKLLTDYIYRFEDKFPFGERDNTRKQMVRSMVSARLNIREGNAFFDKRKLIHFERAYGSLLEVHECALIGFEQNWIKDKEDFDKFDEQFNKCKAMMLNLIKSIR